jgi:hypothetical protein
MVFCASGAPPASRVTAPMRQNLSSMPSSLPAGRLSSYSRRWQSAHWLWPQLARRADPDAGYEPLLVDMLRPVLKRCLAHRIRIVSNFGAANPRGAARRIAALAQELGNANPSNCG